MRLLLTALALCAGPAIAGELVLDLDPAQTIVQFTLGATLHTVHGTFKLKHGRVRYDPATGKIAGEVVIDATSGDSREEGRDRRMHKDVIESRTYPEIVFTPDQVIGTVAAQGDSQVQVHGVFRIHGAAHDMTVPVDVRIAGGRTTATARFTIPYVKWGMKNPSSLLLRVSDKVEIEVTAATR